MKYYAQLPEETMEPVFVYLHLSHNKDSHSKKTSQAISRFLDLNALNLNTSINIKQLPRVLSSTGRNRSCLDMFFPRIFYCPRK